MNRIPPGQTQTKNGKWPVLHAGLVPTYDLATWDFTTSGSVEKPLRLTWVEFGKLPRTRLAADFHCVTTWSRLDMDWEGVPFGVICGLTKPRSSAMHVLAHGDYDYTTNVPLKVLMEEGFLATHEGGKPLSPDHGYPLRLVVPSRYAWKSAKWLRSLEFMDQDRRGFWERSGYHNNADPLTEQRYSSQE